MLGGPASLFALSARGTALLVNYTENDSGNFPLVRFFTRKQYNKRADVGTINRDDNSEDENDANGPKMPWIEDAEGKPISRSTAQAINKCMRSLVMFIAQNNRAPATWSGVDAEVQAYYRSKMYECYPPLGFCAFHWKVDFIMTQHYSAWIKTWKQKGGAVVIKGVAIKPEPLDQDQVSSEHEPCKRRASKFKGTSSTKPPKRARRSSVDADSSDTAPAASAASSSPAPPALSASHSPPQSASPLIASPMSTASIASQSPIAPTAAIPADSALTTSPPTIAPPAAGSALATASSAFALTAAVSALTTFPFAYRGNGSIY